MDISIATEEHHYENRVALTPAAVHDLVISGHDVFIESGAGAGAGFSDEEYLAVGGKIVYSKDEAFLRGKILLKIFPPTLEEYRLMPDEQIIFSSLHLVVAGEAGLNTILEKKITAIGFEVIEDKNGRLPILASMSELAGQMSIPIASYYLSNIGGGRGILLGGGAGIPPATIVILGAGIVGINAARNAKGIGCNVVLIDSSLERLRFANRIFRKQIVTYLPYQYNIEKVIPFADVFIGAVLIHGEQTPKLVSEKMVENMKPGSVILDVSIDQGGCVETSRPTNWHTPAFVKHGVTHFCVPNMPSNVGRTATYALSNVSLPYIKSIADNGLANAIKKDPDLGKGVYTTNGMVTNAAVARQFAKELVPLSEAIGGA
ncbi:MAG: alanine dehydrogenase [Candidatus Zixiibacteriota bacterium]|nr:MAG: alanine dehydrogenase [candidate division Zixibacteria bacterium]